MTAATSQGIIGISLVSAYLTTDTLAVSRNSTINNMVVSGLADFTQAQSISGISTVANGNNVGTGAGIYRDATTLGSTRTLNFRTLASSTDVTVSETATSIVLDLVQTAPFNSLTVTGSSNINTLTCGSLSCGSGSSIGGAISVSGKINGVSLSKFDVTLGGTKPGDLFIFNSSGSLVRLPVGVNAQILAATNDLNGLAWITPSNIQRTLQQVVGTQSTGTFIYSVDNSSANFALVAPTGQGYFRFGEASLNRWSFDQTADVVDTNSPVTFMADATAASINIGTTGTFYTYGTPTAVDTVSSNFILPIEKSSAIASSPSNVISITRDAVLTFSEIGFVAGGYCSNPPNTHSYSYDYMVLNLVPTSIFGTTVKFVFQSARPGTLSSSVSLIGTTVIPTSSGTGLTFNHGISGTSRFAPSFIFPGNTNFSVPFTLETYANVSTNPTFYAMSIDASTIQIQGLPFVVGVPITLPTICINYVAAQ